MNASVTGPESCGTGDIEEITTFARFLELEADWNELHARAASELPFLRHEWLRTWWTHFGGGRELRVLTLRRNGSLVFGLPLLLDRSRAWAPGRITLRSWTNFYSPRFDALGSRDDEGSADLIADHLARKRGWLCLVLEDVTTDGLAASLLLDAARRRGLTVAMWEAPGWPYLGLEGTWETYYRSLKSKFRSNQRNRARRMQSVGPVRYERYEDPEAVLRMLPTALEIEQRGWKGATQSAIASRPELVRFYTDWVSLASHHGWLRLSFLRVGDRYGAFDMSVVYGKRMYCLKIGYDPEFATYSPGQMLNEEILRACFDESLIEYEFLGALTEAKTDWSPQIRRHVWALVYNRDPLSLASHWVRFRLRPAVRSFLRR